MKNQKLVHQSFMLRVKKKKLCNKEFCTQIGTPRMDLTAINHSIVDVAGVKRCLFELERVRLPTMYVASEEHFKSRQGSLLHHHMIS